MKFRGIAALGAGLSLVIATLVVTAVVKPQVAFAKGDPCIYFQNNSVNPPYYIGNAPHTSPTGSYCDFNIEDLDSYCPYSFSYTDTAEGGYGTVTNQFDGSSFNFTGTMKLTQGADNNCTLTFQ